MGCAASRLDNEDTVRRCKERRRLMKEAVYSRHYLASAHSDYLRSLRLTGSALTRFAAGEPLTVTEQIPAILLHHLPHTTSQSCSISSQPPPTPAFTTPPPQRQPYTPSITNSKLPHILSDSSVPSTPSAAPALSASKRHSNRFPNTPSQASTTWDWENFYPPSPPGSDFFNQLKEEAEDEEEESDDGPEENHHHHIPRDNPERHNGVEVHHFRREHYGSSTSSSSKSDCDDNDDEEERYSRSEGTATRSDFGGSSAMGMGARVRPAPSESGSTYSAVGKSMPRERSEFESSTIWNLRDDSSATDDLRMVVGHRDLAGIVASLEEYFEKAASAGDPISDLLEIGRAQLDRSFRQLKKTVYHSNSVLSALSSGWTSKPPLAIRYQLDTGALAGSGVEKSHGSTLDRLLAWEKKLYEEVKAREGVKIEHEKKLSSLQSQEYRGKDEAKIDKTKASINKLQSLIIVTSQAVSTTSSAITQVRDDELAPQLVDICFGTLNMWRSMNQFHEIQSQIVQQVRGLVHKPLSGQSTSDLHRVATRDLESAVSSWHSSFNRLIKFQREYIRALYSWVKLTLLPVSSDDPQKQYSSPIAIELTAFCDEWKQALDRLPDTVASEAIKSVVNVIHVISTKQEEEFKCKKRAETYSKELEKKSTALRAIEKKYYQSYSMVGVGIPGSGHDVDGQVLDARDPLADKKSEIVACRRKVEDEMVRHAKAVEITKSMTLNNIQTGLPGVFQAMTAFSQLFADALQGVCRKAGAVK